MKETRSITPPPGVELSIVVPFYNEAGSVAEFLEELERVLDSLGKRYEILAVDDGSRDETYAALASERKRRPALRLIGLRRNFGQTAALSAGFEAARGEIVVAMDGDLQNDPADIPKLLDKAAEGYDIVSGWRRRRSAAAVSRRIPSRIANALIRCASGTALHDSGCTLKAYRRWVVRDIRLYGEQHRLIPAVASWAGARIAEVEVRDRPRKHGRSHYGIGRARGVLLDLITVRFLSGYAAHPMRAFGRWAMAVLGLGVVSFLVLGYFKIVLGQDVTDHPFFLLSVLCFLVSLQLFSLGLLGEVLVRIYHEAGGKPTYVVGRREGFEDAEVP